MPPRTRLDPVVRLEENREERSLQDLAAANRKLSDSQDALEQARHRALADHRAAGPAGLWELVDSAHSHARRSVVEAEHALQAARTAQGSSRTSYLSVHARAEAIRRLAESRRDELVRAGDQKAAREVDDLVLMRRHGRAG